jgi:U3 small nucleolar RNA-associated protein 20
MYKLISHRLVAQLKVNLRPLWAPTMKALSELSTRCDSVVWSTVFEDLRQLSEGRSLELPPGWAKKSLSDDNDGDDIQEQERTWQDPSAHKMRVAVSSWTSDRVPRRKILEVPHLLYRTSFSR